MSEQAFLLKQCAIAGVLPSELYDDPVHGLCVSLSGIRKLAMLAPDKSRADELIQTLEDALALREITPAGHA